jgi:hypothetical protein
LRGIDRSLGSSQIVFAAMPPVTMDLGTSSPVAILILSSIDRIPSDPDFPAGNSEQIGESVIERTSIITDRQNWQESDGNKVSAAALLPA